jgi:hypothetical protein
MERFHHVALPIISIKALITSIHNVRIFAHSVSLIYIVLQDKLSHVAHKLDILWPCGPKFCRCCINPYQLNQYLHL